MKVPHLNHIINTVQLMMSVLQSGGKIAVHCHAGYGRTGVAIVCTQLYRNSELTPETAIANIRRHRKHCVQTAKQQAFVSTFYHYIREKRIVYPTYPLTLKGFLEAQGVILHGMEWKQLQYCPKLIHVICSRINSLTPSYQALSEAVLRPVIPTETIISSYKSSLNSSIWKDIDLETDLSILCTLLFDWLETALLDPPLLFTSTTSQLLTQVKSLSSVTYTGPVTALINRGKFTLLQNVVETLVTVISKNIDGGEEQERVYQRISLALQGRKSRFGGCFEGRKLVTVTEELRKETEVTVELMREWSLKTG